MFSKRYTPPLGCKKGQIDTPALLIDLDAMEFNLRAMAEFFEESTARLRPHFKTHKTPVIAHQQLEAGAIGITCAKLSEAEVLVASGVKDILIANQIVGSIKISRLADLAHHTRLIVAVDQEDNIRQLSASMQEAGSAIRVLVEVDVGLGRCGVHTNEEALHLAGIVSTSPGLEFSGLLGYEGQAVFIVDRAERVEAVEKAMGKLVEAANWIRKADLPCEIVSAGGTGTYDITGRFPGVTEVEAGSYVLMDTRYRQLDLPFRCALTLLATVISVPMPGRAVIDAGKKALSVEHGLPEVVGFEGIRLVNLHEEHGLIEVEPQRTELVPGQKIELLPSHVCTTVNLHDQFYALREGRLEAMWPIEGRGKLQ